MVQLVVPAEPVNAVTPWTVIVFTADTDDDPVNITVIVAEVALTYDASTNAQEDAAAENMAGMVALVAKSTPTPPESNVENVRPAFAAEALAGVLKPPTLHTTAAFVVTAAEVNVTVREGLA